MNVVVTTPQARGQITLPKRFRDELGITSDTPLAIRLEEKRMVVEPLEGKEPSRYVTGPRYSRDEYLKVIERIVKSGVVMWTKGDDKRREASLKKEREKWERSRW